MAESQHTTTSGVRSKPRVFRVRNLPEHVDRLSAVELLCESIKDIAAQDMRISSLAYDVDVWSWLRTKVATMTLQKIPPDLTSILNGGECTIAVPGLAKPLIIDHKFQGITPLNHVSDIEHKYDCLIISGLASHPFGSWQIHGHDKTFMWIRDELPHRLPGVRFLVYGYDTALAGSTSFQIIPDLAISLVQTMKATGCSAPSAKPVLFLAHSLGGVVLKQTLVLLAGGGGQERAILAKIKGAICFGVPSQGMSIPDIFEMLGNQPNVALVNDLSNQSDFLPRLDEQFGNITYLQKQQFLWAFETKVTPIVEKANTPGKFARTGPGTVMVSRESATRNLCKLQPSLTIQIDKNHSDMVKFGMGDHYIGVLASELQRICALPEVPTTQPAPQTIWNRHPELADPAIPSSPCMDNGNNNSPNKPTLPPEWTLPEFWDDNVILSSLRAPERDRRLEQINQKLGNTFNWVYDDPSVGLSEWLQKGTGIFWINGKPASGKSTLMKYLFQDPRTDELLRAGSLKSRSRLTTASFFFHHRGNHMQKSFEGLLSSLVSQILEQTGSFVSLLYPILQDRYQAQIASAGLGSLNKDIWALLNRFDVLCYSHATTEVEKIVVSQWNLTKTRQLGTRIARMLQDFGVELDFDPRGPFGKVDLDDPDAIMSTSTEPPSFLLGNKLSEWPESTKRTADLIQTLKRQHRREKLRMDIQKRRWSRRELEDCLRRLIGQSIFTMKLFLFLDALDEYDGRPEFIASFLQDLVQQPADPSKQPSTDVRILLSSRPWKALRDEFSACPAFQIHDYTWNDMIDLCAASIPAEATAKTLLFPFVTEIVRRARGVFLWIKLVMRDLADVVREASQQRDTQELKQELRKTLDGIPDELGDYYGVIIQRIPPGTRWESYVVLETLARADHDISTTDLLAILKCSYAKSHADARKRLAQKPQMSLDAPGLDWAEHYIEAVSGGLIEFGSDTKSIVQFMHQTVKQFVLEPWFRLQLLGTNIGALTTENGHSFISKYLFVESDFDLSYTNHTSYTYHAREAEVTTGFSQYDFFSTAPMNLSSTGPSEADPKYLPPTIKVAVIARLKLCLNDAHNADRDCIQRNSAMLINLLLDGLKYYVRDGVEPDHFSTMAEVLVDKGLSVHETGGGLLEVVQRMWGGKNRGMSLKIGGKRSWGLIILNDDYEQLACTLAGAISRPNAPTGEFPSRSASTRSNSLVSKAATNELLHYATPQLTKEFLARGLDPNSLNGDGKTPIDSALADGRRYAPSTGYNLPFQYDIVYQLVCAGGVLRSVKRSQWNQWEKECAKAGFDTAVFREAGLPRWLSGPRKHQESMRQYLCKVFRVK